MQVQSPGLQLSIADLVAEQPQEAVAAPEDLELHASLGRLLVLTLNVHWVLRQELQVSLILVY